jgi:hypothetical protein
VSAHQQSSSVIPPEAINSGFASLAISTRNPIPSCIGHRSSQACSICKSPLSAEHEPRGVFVDTLAQIKAYIAAQPEPKQSDMQQLHHMILELMPKCKLWFLDGKDEKGKVVSNPNIGYGSQAMKYAGGKTREFYQIGVSANTTGISVYIMGIEDRKYLAQTFAKKLGKASVTGYCIKFKTLADIKTDVLKAAMQYGIEQTSD